MRLVFFLVAILGCAVVVLFLGASLNSEDLTGLTATESIEGAAIDAPVSADVARKERGASRDVAAEGEVEKSPTAEASSST